MTIQRRVRGQEVQSASASQKQTSCLNPTMRVDRIGAAVLTSSPMTTRLFTTMQWTVFGSTNRSVWTRTRFRLSYSACTLKWSTSVPLWEETIEREDPSRASVQWYRQARFGGWLQQVGWSVVCVCEISGDTRESVNKANKLDQELVDTCSTQSGWGQTGPVFRSEARKEAEQTVVMVRLSEEIIQTSQQTKEKQSCLETVRTAREETTATVQANIEACMDAFVLVFTVHTAVVEHHTDMNDAQRVTTRTSWSWAGDETSRRWLTEDGRCARHWECTDRLNQHWGLRRRWNTQDVTQDGVHAEVRQGTGWHISLQRERTKKGPDHAGAGVAVKRQEQLGVSSQGAKDLPQGLAERTFASSDRTRRWTCLLQVIAQAREEEHKTPQQKQAPPDM